jgi:hypothetical protein
VNKIIFPLKSNMQGESVANLHEGLQLLMNNGVPKMGSDDRQAIEEGLSVEREKMLYGQATHKLVAMLQEHFRLEPSGEVDEATSLAFNGALEKLGAFATAAAATDQLRVAGGQVHRGDGVPYAGGLIRAFHKDERSMLRLGEDTTDAAGRYTIRYMGLPGADATHLQVVVYARDAIKPLYETDVIRNAGALEIVDAVVPVEETAEYQVSGAVSSRIRAGVGGLQVIIVDKTAGDDVPLAKADTGEGGGYLAVFAATELRRRGKERPDLQAIVYARGKAIARSSVRYNAANRETLNVQLDEKASFSLSSEHDTLKNALAAHIGGKLRDLKESEERQDITYLANKTGWDARAVALASLADRFAAESEANVGSESGIEPAFFYALFRAGLPANEEALYRTDTSVVEGLWKQAIAHGVIPAELSESLGEAVERYRQMATRRALDNPAAIGVSPLKEVVSVSLGDDKILQTKFAELHTRYRGDMPKFWMEVRAAFGEAAENRLRLDGQLAYLTLNNAPLIRKLHAAGGRQGLADSLQLVEGGYFRADKWQGLIGQDPIPPEIPGDSDAERRVRYAELLSAQVRLSFPTSVVAQMVKSGSTPLAAEGMRSQVHAFLTGHQGKFEIGAMPVEQYAARNQIQLAPETMREVARIQRVYQITPSDDAMNALLARGVDSAFAVLRYDLDEFIQAFSAEVGGEQHARLIHAKSQQVHNAVLNVAVAYLTASRPSGIGIHGLAQMIDSMPAGPIPNASDVIAYPALESLFGELDYCSCDHCRSILSPAAYLVDLLQYIDRPVYPTGFNNPQAVLLERRPDIQHLPLTCENTNTPLPYLDLVNEALEYFVANQLSLAGYTGHNTDGQATTEQLLANPQYVSDRAYEILAGMPSRAGDLPPPLPPAPGLPFHRPLEQLRRNFDTFNAPLSEVMEALRMDDAIERASDGEYGWRDIWMEELRLSRAEYALLTDRALTLAHMYGFPQGTGDAEVVDRLSNVKSFADRMVLSYEDIIAVLNTRFVNPGSTLIPRLERLGVPFSVLKAYKEGAMTDEQLAQALAPQLDAAQYGGDIGAWVRNEANYSLIMNLITLQSPDGADDSCSFGELELRYTDPDIGGNKLRPFEFVRMYRFIRLWKKLGWTIEQTDKAIAALYPSDQVPDDPDDTVNLQRLDEGFLQLLPRLGAVKRAMGALKLKLKTDLLPLLTCFGPIDTHGADSLYRQMFLNPSLLKRDGAFNDNGYGQFMDGSEKLLVHTEELRAAFQLTGEEYAAITGALGYDAATPLTVNSITEIFRRGWLARKLKCSVRELLLLISFSGIDPFAQPDPVHPPMLRFIELAERLRSSSLKPAQALYLIWNQDMNGSSVPGEEEICGFIRLLSSGFAAIEAEFAWAEDPNGEIARSRLEFIYGSEAAGHFIGLLNGSVVTDTRYGHGQAALEQAITDAAPPGGLAYDHLRKRLSYHAGVMSEATRDALKGAAGATAPFQAAVDELYAGTRAFFLRYPELLPHFEAYVGSGEPDEKKRSDLLARLLPELRLRRKRQYALQAVAAATKVDAGFAEAVLADPAVLHAAGSVLYPALDDVIAAGTPGLSAHIYFRDTAGGPVDYSSEAEAELAYAAGGANRLPVGPAPEAVISGVWSGYLEAPDNGFYNFRIEADAGAVVTFLLDGVSTVTENSGVWSNQAPIELRAGKLYAVRLQVEKVKDKMRLCWETSGHGWETIPGRQLYPALMSDRIRQVYVRFKKSSSLAEALGLTGAEFASWAAHADYRIGGQGWLNSLPVEGVADSATSGALFSSFWSLLDYARMKAELAPDDERLLKLLKDPAAAADSPEGLLYTLTRWEPASLAALLLRFGKDTADLASLETFSRIYDAYAWLNRLQISAAALLQAATNEPDAAVVNSMQSALRARYDDNGWMGVLKPINDAMRGLQRDALVAYIIHQLRDTPAAHIDTPEKLFEYFLMDVQMEPCMQTSRIRFALSSVQLFIERSLMNLEPRVSSSSIPRKQWEWMHLYRLWEANRKLFLYPENWLEPELRDDQSPFFKEAMSELLQSDITEHAAAKALGNYLSKLDEVAKLEPCGIHYAEHDPNKAEDDIAHVVARTAGASRSYYYRRREYGCWTPWEQIKLEIEDNPVIPVLWRERLFLFWIKIVQEAPLQKPQLPSGELAEVDVSALVNASSAKLTVKAILCWSEHYNGKWQSARTSDVRNPLVLKQYDPAGTNPFDRSKLKLSVSESEGALKVHISGQGGAVFLLYNTHSLPVNGAEAPISLINLYQPPSRYLDTANDGLTIGYTKSSFLLYPGSALQRPVLENPIRGRTVQPAHRLERAWDAPFFYEDSRHVFYVSTEQRIVSIPGWSGYIPFPSQKPDLAVPDLILPELQLDPRPVLDMTPYGVIAREPEFGAVSTPSVGSLLSEDAYISKAIGTLGSVSFDGKSIGPLGALKEHQQ